jgi:peptide/nickel transport system permease protein
MSIGTPTSNVPAAPDPFDDNQLADAGIETNALRPTATTRRLKLPPTARAFLANKKALFGLSLFSTIMMAAICAPLLTSADPNEIGQFDPRLHPSMTHPFGTTDYGQDVFAQALYGARVTLLLAAFAALLATVIATTFGLLAAYRPGFIDDTVNMFTNIFLVIPILPLLIVVSAFIPQRGPVLIAFMIGLTAWAGETRILRGQALGLRGRDFILAAKMTGESTWKIVFGEFMPNMISRIVAGFILTFQAAIFFEAALEFLGFGDPHIVTWGTMLFWAANGSAVLSGEWWDFVFPGLAIAFTIVALVFLQYGVDEVSNPKLRNLPKRKRRRGPIGNIVRMAVGGRASGTGITT